MKKILLVKLSSLGDVLVSTPFPHLIKQSMPNVEVHHLVMEHCRVITEHNPWVDKQIVLKFIPSGKRMLDLARVLSVAWSLAIEKYDAAFIFHRSILFQVLCFCCGIRNLYGFSSRINPFYRKHIIYRYDVNRTIQERELLRLGGIDVPEVLNLEFYPRDKELSRALCEVLPRQYIACNPGGGNLHAPADNRMWPIQNYAELIAASPLPFVILGQGVKDEGLVAYLLSVTNPSKIINLVNKTTFSESALILERATVYVGNDSSLMFLAASMKVPTIGLYGPTQAAAANPIGPRQFSIKGEVSCAPCYNPYHGIKGKMYTCNDNICMRSIAVSMVLDQLLTLLRSERHANK